MRKKVKLCTGTVKAHRLTKQERLKIIRDIGYCYGRYNLNHCSFC